jgi:hypothetical protein
MERIEEKKGRDILLCASTATPKHEPCAWQVAGSFADFYVSLWLAFVDKTIEKWRSRDLLRRCSLYQSMVTFIL